MDNFYDTAQRMQKSSELLHNEGEYHNACYLAGYVIECYAKIIVGISYSFGSDELIVFGHDLKRLKKEFDYIINHSAYSSYFLDMETNFSTILKGSAKWLPEKRYIPHNNVWQQVHSNNFQAEIQLAMQQLANMKINGIQLI